MKLPNHYETLNVSKDASSEEIRSSFVELCKLFQTSQEMIQELSKAYEVLKSPDLRSIYDTQILASLSKPNTFAMIIEAELEMLPPVPATPAAIEKNLKLDEVIQYRIRERAEFEKERNGFGSRIAAALAAVAVLGTIAAGIISNPGLISRVRLTGLNELTKDHNYLRPTTAPNGQAFPEATGYITGYEQKNANGNSTLLIDNTRNEHDVYLKLLVYGENKTAAVRHIFIKAKTDFKIDTIAPGKYEVKYIDLEAGLGGRSVSFDMSESNSVAGLKGTDLKITLKTAINGVLSVEPVSVEEFNSIASM